MMSGDVAVNMDRRRTSIGVDERALTTLEKFVELCESELNEEDEDNEDDLSSANPSTSEGPPPPSGGGGGGGVKKCPSTGDAMKEKEKSRKEKIYSRLNSLSWNYKPKKSDAHKVKLSELFIDPSLVAMKTKSENSSQNNGTSGATGASGGAGGGGAQPPTSSSEGTGKTKKSEEIWVKRVNDPGRRSFRITNLRGQELPTIYTEDVDEESSGDGSYPQHYHTVTGATPGIQQMLKPILLSKGERERHRSGDDINLAGKKKTSLMDVFRPRSKSDASKLKKPNFMSKMQNSILGGESQTASSSSTHRPRSGSESTKSPVSKVMDIFRTRSHSVTTSEEKRKKHGSSNSWIQQGRRGSLHSHRPADALIDPAHAAILFRDSRGLPVADPFLERILTLSEEDQTEILVKFFKFHKCYDLIPTSAKLVVFDTQLLVKKAFFALVYNGVRAAPLWDSSVRQFVGMLTITDFIRVLHAMYHDSAGRMSELEEHRIETWRRRFLQDKQPLIFIDPDASLFDAICSLVNSRIHRLPIIDQQTGNVLHILTHKRILKFLFLYIHEIPRPTFLTMKLGDVRIGTYDNVETAREDTSIIEALQKFLDRRVSALPIVDEENKLLDIYARFDVINLAAEKTYNNLDITLKQANEHRNEWFEGVHKCTLDETLYVIMERIVKAEVHRLVVVDDLDRVVGVLSLSDILQYLVMRPEVQDIDVPDLKDLQLRGESPRPEVLTRTGSSASPVPSFTPPPTRDTPTPSLPLEDQEEEANNNDNNDSKDNDSISDLNEQSDGNEKAVTTVEEENEKNLNGHAVGSS